MAGVLGCGQIGLLEEGRWHQEPRKGGSRLSETGAFFIAVVHLFHSNMRQLGRWAVICG